MHNQKNSLRKQMKEVIAQLTEEQRFAFAEKASAYLLESALWQESQKICLFASYGNEIDTRFVLNSAWEQDKQVFLPLCWTHKEGEMDFYRCRGFEDLQLGRYGIMEPSETAREKGRLVDSPDLIVVPGLAFTDSGLRLGKGGGYYDRFMNREMCRNSKRVGFAFAVQKVPVLPAEPWDLLLHYLCTEKGIKRTPQPFEQTFRNEYD